jgi:hypothetical protein
VKATVLLPAAIVIASPVQATVYLTVEQAQDILFPGATLIPDFQELTPAQVSAIEKLSGVSVRGRKLRLWRASTGGFLIVDQVVGKHDYIPFAVALDEEGAVKGVEILEYRESYGGQIRDPQWRAQFAGKHEASLKFGKDIRNISGATLSSRHITDGVKRLLATHAVLFGEH